MQRPMCSAKLPNSRGSTVPTRKVGSIVMVAGITPPCLQRCMHRCKPLVPRCNMKAAPQGPLREESEAPVRVRLQDVADQAGVSVKTVSNVVNGYIHVAAETRARVQAVIDETGYRPNLSARQLRTGRTGV